MCDETIHIVLLELFDLIACTIDDCPFVVRNDHVILTKRNPRLKRFAEAHGHDLITEDHRFLLTTVAVDRVDHVLNVFFTQQAIDQRERRLGIARQERSQTHTARRGFKALHHFVTIFVDLRNACRDFGVQMHIAIIKRVLHFVDGAKGHAFALHAFAHDGRVIETQNHIL